MFMYGLGIKQKYYPSYFKYSDDVINIYIFFFIFENRRN